jgi:hypothetical protein
LLLDAEPGRIQRTYRVIADQRVVGIVNHPDSQAALFIHNGGKVNARVYRMRD